VLVADSNCEIVNFSMFLMYDNNYVHNDQECTANSSTK